MCDFLSVIFYVNIHFDALGSRTRESSLVTGFSLIALMIKLEWIEDDDF